jgi:Glucodextranase, domain B
MKIKILGFVLLGLLIFVGAIGCAGEEVTTPTQTSTSTPVASPTTAPANLFLTVTAPQNESILSSANIAVEGITSPGAVVSVSVDGNLAIADVDATGNFEAMISLVEGPNFIEVVASDQQGHEESATITVIYVP